MIKEKAEPRTVRVAHGWRTRAEADEHERLSAEWSALRRSNVPDEVFDAYCWVEFHRRCEYHKVPLNEGSTAFNEKQKEIVNKWEAKGAGQ